MVISHEYRYLFIEVPETASWAIRNELCEYYAGEPILHKHASYIEYYRAAPRAHLDYFVFATVRNPLDCLVSRYIKYTHPKPLDATAKEMVDKLIVDYADFGRYKDIHDHDLSFSHYFKKYHRRPVGEMIDLSSNRLDYVIRYENLQDDFAVVLSELQIKPVRPIPIINKTKGKDRTYQDYYEPEVIRQAKRVCGPFMKKWGYEFPESWGAYSHSWIDEVEYALLNKLKYVYMTNIRYNNASYSRAIRRLRAQLFH